MNAGHITSPRKTLRRAAVYGLLWGVALTAGEALVLPFGQLASLSRLTTFFPIMVQFVLAGILIAWLTMTLEHRLDRAWKILIAIVALSVWISALHEGIWILTNALGMAFLWQRLLGEGGASWSNYFYVMWMILFHGGLFMIACLLTVRGERSRKVWGEAEIARSRTEGIFETAQLDELRGRVDPSFLMQAMGAVRNLYATDTAGADRLLDELVGFLRIAMPGVRSGASTLAVEVELARSYTELSAAIHNEQPKWKVESSRSIPNFPFPPLLLLPLMDALTDKDALTGAGHLQVRFEGTRLIIAFRPLLSAGPVELLPDLRYRAQVALQSLFDRAWRLVAHPATTDHGPRLVVEIETAGVVSPRLSGGTGASSTISGIPPPQPANQVPRSTLLGAVQ